MPSRPAQKSGDPATELPGHLTPENASEPTGLDAAGGVDQHRLPLSPRALRRYRIARFVGLLLLAAVTIYGVREFALSDWQAVSEFWVAKLPYLPLVLGLAVLDVVFEGMAWMWVYERFGIRARDSFGARAFLAGNAGMLMPAQLGRLIRPDALVRLGRGTPGQCVKAEAAAFVLDSVSVAALLAALAAWYFHPVLAPLAGAAVIAGCLFVGNQLAERLSATRLRLPPGFWWRWQSAAIVLVQMLGWIAHGLAFYLLITDLPGNVGLWDALFFPAASSVLGVGSGLPGGIGATEGLLAAGLQINQFPAEHLGLVVGGFRVATFWMWIPIGWLALALLRARAAPAELAPLKEGLPAAPLPVRPGIVDTHVDGS